MAVHGRTRTLASAGSNLVSRKPTISMIWVENVAYLVEIHPDHGNRKSE
jgi:hypothetical protein